MPADPAENLDMLRQPCERKRLARLAAHGVAARRLLDEELRAAGV